MMKMKLCILSLIVFFGLVSCSKDKPIVPDPERTIFVYMPLSYQLMDDFDRNLTDLKKSIVEKRIQTDRFIVFLAESSAKANLFELKYENGECKKIALKSYDVPAFITAEGITGILKEVVSRSKTSRYAMIIGSHGMGWIPASLGSRSTDSRPHWEEEGSLTRYFGDRTSGSLTDIATLEQGIAGAGLHLEYMLFDDCYMSNIETAYELKAVTDYLIGCPTEIMSYGFPYHLIGEHLTGTVDYAGVVEGFYQFYSNYTSGNKPYPYGTVAVTKCSELGALAAAMKNINRNFIFDDTKLGSIQPMDGGTTADRVKFFDLGDYAAKLCTDATLLADFNAQLVRTVPVKEHTPEYPVGDLSAPNGLRTIPIRTYSGITVSDPSRNSETVAKTTTAWWKATHD